MQKCLVIPINCDWYTFSWVFKAHHKAMAQLANFTIITTPFNTISTFTFAIIIIVTITGTIVSWVVKADRKTVAQLTINCSVS